MPPSISLLRLSWSTPDGVPLLTDLDLSLGPERTGVVGRNGTGKTTLLRLLAGDLRPASGRMERTGTIAMMRQEATTRPGATVADLLGARGALDLLARAEAGLADADALAEADWTLPARIETALARCGLLADPGTPLETLSGGQRTRAALAALVLAAPDFMLLDEPTNNLDHDGRRAVIELVRGWRAGALIASHDRALLEEVDAIVELTPAGAHRYGGNYGAFRQRKDTELAAAQRDLAHAEKTLLETARRGQQAAERKLRKDSAGRKARAKGDQPRILMDAARARAEVSGGAGARQGAARRATAEAALSGARDQVEILEPLRMEVPPTGLPAGRLVLRLDRASGGYDPAQPVIRDLSLTLTGPERVAVTGPNGSGKTTLLKLVTGAIAPQAGRVAVMVPFVFLDQHVGLLDPAASLRDNFRRLSPSADAGAAHAALARFGFRAADALRPAGALSGGERLRAGLACALGATPTPMLLILDEPTNHLDLAGIAALEAALRAYDGAVLAVSHDAAFLDTVGAGRTVHLSG